MGSCMKTVCSLIVLVITGCTVNHDQSGISGYLDPALPGPSAHTVPLPIEERLPWKARGLIGVLLVYSA